jgi:type I restriction enzyme R subunit
MSADSPLLPFHLFDGDADVLITQRALPHWAQAGTICFITWRTHDSMPGSVLERWFRNRRNWLEARGVDCGEPGWQRRLKEHDPGVWREFRDIHWNRWHDALDAGHGCCDLRDPLNSEVVSESLRHFNGTRYLLFDYVVMPNHVHLLAAFPSESGMLAQCRSWKHYTARRMNQRRQRAGRFWQPDAFDHLVRTERQFEYLRRYIAANPHRAGLAPGQAPCYSRPLETDA